MSDQGSGPPPGQGWGPPQGQPPQGQQPPPPPGQPPPYWGPPQPPPYGYGPPPQYGYGPQPPTEGMAITALVLSIASVMFLFTFFLAPVGLVLAIVALALCPSAQRKIEGSGGALTGEGLITASKIISWISIGLIALGVLVLGIIAIAAAATEDEFSLALSLLAA
ncbi:MAG: hypothetical protein M3N31_09970 [Actinomycetota bacterium]|nr:hypothetical protein [Actinomycetota bacterium]